jgi:uncharacterized protein (TIGR00369 family)
VGEEPNGSALVRGFLDHSPFGQELGLELAALEADRAELVLRFRDRLTTYGDVVHGGAIGTLIDVAATAAAWSDAEISDSPRGATVSLTVDFLRAARGRDLRAVAEVARRGGQICFCEVDVSEEGGELVAKALVTYKLS